jgi:soluble lytic murein transglycosylase-like protein
MRFCFALLGCVAAGTLQAGDVPTHITRRVETVRTDARTGKLVRSVLLTPRSVAERTVPETVVTPRVVNGTDPVSQPASASSGIEEAVNQIAAAHSLPPQLIHSVIKVESNYNPFAVSNKGALGLMQLIPSTARRFGVSNVFNPVENIQGGAKYLRYLLDLYRGSYPLALAAYNAGEGAVAKYRGVPPYRETQNYLVLVRRQLDKAAAKPVVKPEPKPVEVKHEGPPRIRQIVEADGSVRFESQ